MNSDEKTIDRIREVLQSEPDLLSLLLRLSDLVDLLTNNLRMGQAEAVIQGIMERITAGGSSKLPVLGVLPKVILINELRFIGDKNGLRLGSSMTQGCRVAASTAQSIPNNVDTAIAFDVDSDDTDDMHDIAVNNTRITFKTEGVYLVGGATAFVANAVGNRRLRLLVNGSGIHTTDSRVNTGATETTALLVSLRLKVAKDDFLELVAFQDSGGALSLIRNGSRSPNFWVQRVM